ncbi:Protein of unknown function [Lactobacillus helveticus CIRM-BIA 951]|uniref:Uncharacterized protein n=1 Tax=Lactobacillus helveticus CIRM-BIA 951 TaxID=1226334 RepID=U6F1U8_LACHE|nr:Protein of unknown function [Lactobacillus helveticus CIRM-BIA 951]
MRKSGIGGSFGIEES